jgi:hypothetical protein
VSLTLSAGFLIAVALIAANFPFLSSRVFGVFQLKQKKSLLVRFLELVVFYCLCGAVGVGLEARIGNISSQGWEFYAITATLFLTLAFPGFVYRYMVLRDH